MSSQVRDKLYSCISKKGISLQTFPVQSSHLGNHPSILILPTLNKTVLSYQTYNVKILAYQYHNNNVFIYYSANTRTLRYSSTNTIKLKISQRVLPLSTANSHGLQIHDYLCLEYNTLKPHTRTEIFFRFQRALRAPHLAFKMIIEKIVMFMVTRKKWVEMLPNNFHKIEVIKIRNCTLPQVLLFHYRFI